MASKETDQYLANWHDELNNAALYQALAEAEKDPRLAEVYRRLATVEQRHADTWVKQLQSAGITMPAFQPTWRTRTLIWLAQRFGVGFVLPSITTMEEVAGHTYNQQAGPATMVAEEQSHARLLRQITRGGGLEGGALAQLEGRHRAAGGNALRAAVLGANDGLVSNLSLVMGVAGAELSGTSILITGLAGLLAGACSMALGGVAVGAKLP